MSVTRRREGTTVLRLEEGRRGGADSAVLALTAGHAQLRALCDRLERMADALPELPPPEVRNDLAWELAVLLPGHLASERTLLEGLAAEAGDARLGQAILGQIASLHALDEMHAQDLSQALHEPDLPAGGAATLGYMLRCFFDGCRRAMAFGELGVAALVRPRLSAAMLALLCTALAGEGDG